MVLGFRARQLKNFAARVFVDEWAARPQRPVGVRDTYELSVAFSHACAHRLSACCPVSVRGVLSLSRAPLRERVCVMAREFYLKDPDLFQRETEHLFLRQPIHGIGGGSRSPDDVRQKYQAPKTSQTLSPENV